MADAPTWATGRTHRALLIGNARLGSPSERFGPLRSPPGDVAALRAALIDADRGLHARRHVQVILDAPRDRVLAALRAFFDGAGADDQLLLFYSGHGLADERAALHLGTSDTMAQFPVSTAVPAEVIGQLADASPAAAVAIILDCRYGDAWPGSPSAGLAGPQRLVLASPSGVPRADDDDRVSAFTEVVAAGLTAGPAADRNRDGLVSFAELCAFVTAELTEAGDPPPERWLPPAGADVPVARVGNPARGPRPGGGGPAGESEWRLPGEEAPLVPAGGPPGSPWGQEPPFPPAPQRVPEPPFPPAPQPVPEPLFPPAPRPVPEPSPRRVPVGAASPAGPSGRPGGEAPPVPVAPAPHQAALLPGPGVEPAPVPPAQRAAGPPEWSTKPAGEPEGLLAGPYARPEGKPAREPGPAPSGPAWPDDLTAVPEPDPPGSSPAWADDLAAVLEPRPPPSSPAWPDDLAAIPEPSPPPPGPAWPDEPAADLDHGSRSGPGMEPDPFRLPGPARPAGPPDDQVWGRRPGQPREAAARRPAGPDWPDGLAADPGWGRDHATGSDDGGRIDPDEAEPNPYQPVPSVSSAAQRAFPSEILPPGPAVPAGPTTSGPGPVTAPGPASGGSRRDRSRRGSVAPTDIHRPGSQLAGADRDGPVTNLPLAGTYPPEAGDPLMAEIRSRVVERGERVLTLVGRGAVGPASPMVRYAGQHAQEYQVCWWLRAHDPALLAEDWRSLAAELGLPAHSDLLRAVPALRGWLENQENGPWLLVLDGAPAPEEIAPYVPKSGHGQVLITATSPGWEELSSSTPLLMSAPWAADPRRLRPPSRPATPPPPAGPPPAGPPPSEQAEYERPGGRQQPTPEPPAAEDPWVERQPLRAGPPPAGPTRARPPPTGELPVQQEQPHRGPRPGPPPREAGGHERPGRQQPPAPETPWVERQPSRAGQPRAGPPPSDLPVQPAPPVHGRPAPPRRAQAGAHGEPIRGEPLPPGRHLPPADPVNGRSGAGRPVGDVLGASGRQEILHWDQALKRLRRASPQAAALLQLAAFLDSEAIPVGLLAMTGVVLPGELGASLRDPQAFRIALATLAQRGMVALSGDQVAVPPLAQIAVGSALGAEGVRTWAAYALRVLGIVLALPASEGKRPAWAEPSHLLPHAEAAARHALALGVRTAELPTVLNEIGVHLLRMHRPDLAVPYLERALGLAREVHGLKHREVVRALDHLALAHRELGDQALAMRLHGEALAIGRSLDRLLLHDHGRYPGRP